LLNTGQSKSSFKPCLADC